jgi:hypothetical protein
MTHMFTVQVLFATSSDYRDVGKTGDEAIAMREARSYLSDSRGIRVVKPNGDVIHVTSVGAWVEESAVTARGEYCSACSQWKCTCARSCSICFDGPKCNCKSNS